MNRIHRIFLCRINFASTLRVLLNVFSESAFKICFFLFCRKQSRYFEQGVAVHELIGVLIL